MQKSVSRRRVVLWVALGVVGFLTIPALKLLSDWQEESRAQRVAQETLRDNPDVPRNAALISEAVESAFHPPVLPLARETQREPAGVPQPDAMWGKFERTRFSLPEKLGHADLTAELLFRNIRLNPMDTFIAPTVRAELESYIGSSKLSLATLCKAYVDVSHQEFEYLRNRGVTKSVSFQDYEAAADPAEKERIVGQRDAMRAQLLGMGLPPEKIEKQMATFVSVTIGKISPKAFTHGTHNGIIHWAGLKEMPQTRQACEAYYAFAFGMACTIVDFFKRNAGLTSAQEAAIVEEVERSLQRFVVN